MEEESSEEEEVIIHLTSSDPQAITSSVRFDFQQRRFVAVPARGSVRTIRHLSLPSTCRRGEPAAGCQLGCSKPVNKFRFMDRASQTRSCSVRTTETQISGPPTATFSGTVNKWVIYDSYVEYEGHQEETEKIENVSNSKSTVLKDEFEEEQSGEIERKMLFSAKILERIVNQNIYKDIIYDFKYFEDKSDDFKDCEGSLMPLWKFSFDPINELGLEVTSVCWNPRHNGLFAVGFGSYDFYRQPGEGRVCVFSLANPAHPEYRLGADSGVVSLAWHPAHPHMLAAGLSSGNTAVFNLQRPGERPAFSSGPGAGKQAEPVVAVEWMVGEDLALLSLSGTGLVTLFTIVRTSFTFSTIFRVKFPRQLVESGQEDWTELLADGGCSTPGPQQY